MIITLEKPELVSLLIKALGYNIKEEDVVVRADPFEVQLRNINVEDLSTKETQKEVKEMPPAYTDAPAPAAPRSAPDVPLDQLLSKSDILVSALPRNPGDRSLNDFHRALADNESLFPPGDDYLGEVRR